MKIEIDDNLIPDGWEAVRVDFQAHGDERILYAGDVSSGPAAVPNPMVIVRRKQPRRWEVEECDLNVHNGTVNADGWSQPVRIVREIKKDSMIIRLTTNRLGVRLLGRR